MLVKLSPKQYFLPLMIWCGAVAVIFGGTLVMAANANVEFDLKHTFGFQSADWESVQDCEAETETGRLGVVLMAQSQ
ncbi:MAG: hypothetical protein AAF438_20790 [Pseudomonadota bacterium]